MNNHTEPIINKLTTYCSEFKAHSFFKAAAENKIPQSILNKFAFYQYSDSILWIPMLALMKEKVIKSSRLRKAIEENIKHEAGVGGISHVTLAKNLMRSMKLTKLQDFPISTFAKSAQLWLSKDFDEFAEPEIGGWLLTAETLVPLMFRLMLPAFQNKGYDNTYFSEHISVDGDEHSQWMLESVDEIIGLYGQSSVPQVLAGMEDAWLETLEVPNQLVKEL